MLVAAVHESVCGTNRTNWTGLMMSPHRGRPEVGGPKSSRRDWPMCDIGPAGPGRV